MSDQPLPPKSSKANLEQAAASDESIQRVHAILAREKPEPAEGYSPMPLFLLGLISALIFICCIYVVHYGGRQGFGPLVYDENFDPSKVANKQAAAVDPIQAGRRLYATCATCHQANGNGIPGVYPPLAGAEWVVGSEERLIRILLHGLSGPVTVKGNTYNGAMPAFGQVPGSGYNWTDERIAHVLTFIRQEWGNTAGPITTEQVTAIRTQGAAGRAKAWSEAELLALP